MRWYCKITAVLYKWNFKPIRRDCCVFARFRKLKEGERGYTPDAKETVTCVIAIHVDDVLYVGTQADLADLEKCMAEFKHGEWEYLTTKTPNGLLWHKYNCR